MMNDIDEWGCPERLGLRREKSDRVLTAGRGGVVAILLGVGIWGLGAMAWSGDLAFLKAFDSAPGRAVAALCAASGVLGLLLSRAAFWNKL